MSSIGLGWNRLSVLLSARGAKRFPGGTSRYLLQCTMRIAVLGYSGGRGPLFFRCSRPVIPLLFGAGFRAKGPSDQSVSGKNGRKRPVSGEIAVPALSAPAENRGFPRPLPPFAANPLHLQPDADRIAARSRGRIPTSGMRCRGAVITMSGVISSAVGIRRPPRCIG